MLSFQLYHLVFVTKAGQKLKCNFLGSVPLGQYLPCHPCSDSPTVSKQNYRWLKLHLNETGHELLARIEKMRRMDKFGHVVGFIIGSTLTRSSQLPTDVFREIVKCLQDKGEFPPLIVLKATDYDQFQKHAKSHMSSVKEMKCLSNKGSKYMFQ